MKIRIDPFIAAIFGVTLLAYLLPEGANGKFPLDSVATAGVTLIFFFYGLKLSPEKIKAGLKNWKLHLLVQSSVFLIFPLIVLAGYPLVHDDTSEILFLAFLFMAALPSTVSSSVVMVSVAGGNLPAAIFNASISGLIGIVITPLWMAPFLESSSASFDLSSIYLDLLLQILAPVIAGLVLQPYLREMVRRNNRWLTVFDKSVILLIIYKSFAQSFNQGVFSSVSIADLLFLTILVTVLFLLMYFLTGFLAKRLDFDEADEITAKFCGTKKSLVHGTVFSKIIFPPGLSAGLVLLPLMLFHALQILIISSIASGIARKRGNIE